MVGRFSGRRAAAVCEQHPTFENRVLFSSAHNYACSEALAFLENVKVMIHQATGFQVPLCGLDLDAVVRHDVYGSQLVVEFVDKSHLTLDHTLRNNDDYSIGVHSNSSYTRVRLSRANAAPGKE